MSVTNNKLPADLDCPIDVFLYSFVHPTSTICKY